MRLVLGSVDVRSCGENIVERTGRKLHRPRQLRPELHLLLDSEAQRMHPACPHRAGTGNLLVRIVRPTNQMLLQVAHDQGVHRERRRALAEWPVLVLPPSPSRTRAHEGPTLEPGVEIQAHPEFAAHVQVRELWEVQVSMIIPFVYF